MVAGRDVVLGRPRRGPRRRRCHPVEVEAEAPYLLAYTSGTTGRPKGALHVQGGFLVSIAREVAYQSDVRAGDRILFATDMGWIMGPWTVVGGGAARRDRRLRRGRPRLAARPALAARRGGARDDARRLADPRPGADPERRARRRPLVAPCRDDDRRALEPRPLRLARRARLRLGAGSRSSTSPAAPRSAPASSRSRPLEPTKPVLARLPGARPGDGRVRPGRGSRCAARSASSSARRPWPGMTRGIWGDDERYLETYWRRFPGVWTHGDWASVDEDGYWFLHGRSDDTLNVAGQADRAGRARVGGAERPGGRRGGGDRRAARGQGRGAVAVRRRQARRRRSTRSRWPERVGGRSSGRRSGRRASSSCRRCRRRGARRSCAEPSGRRALGTDPGDLSTLENPESLEAIRSAV